MLDALGLALGDRAESSMVRAGTDRADIYATFDLGELPEAQAWLKQRELLAGEECLLRRIITSEGRSRAYINGQPVTLQDLKAFSGQLIDINSQHAHQSLLKKEQQQRLLDDFAKSQALAAEVKTLAGQHHHISQQVQTLQDTDAELSARQQLLRYQVEELQALALQDNELAELEQEHKLLANGEQSLQNCQHALNLCQDGDNNLSSLLSQAINQLTDIADTSSTLSNASQLLNEALIQVNEAGNDLQLHIDNFEMDPQRLQWLDQRLSGIYDIARKHRCKPESLPELHAQLEQELAELESPENSLEALLQEQQQLADEYAEKAGKLSKLRKKAAIKLEKAIEQQLADLAMGNCRFKIDLQPYDSSTLHNNGHESIQFLINTNSGQTLQPLAKIASGGELSRISLAIQVIVAKTSTIPTMIFDEVDVGIGGATAEVVGKLLRELGDQGQVICVTHQAQVASQGHHHLVASKSSNKKQTTTQLQALNSDSKIEEVARMLGGIAITERSRDHAREMLLVAH